MRHKAKSHIQLGKGEPLGSAHKVTVSGQPQPGRFAGAKSSYIRRGRVCLRKMGRQQPGAARGR